MISVNCGYNIAEDIAFIMEAQGLKNTDLSDKTGISRVTLDVIKKSGKTTDSVCEKFYSYAYANKYRINTVREEILKERFHDVLFHGSKDGISEVTVTGSRKNCDFGKGFYCGETYNQALSFVCENAGSSVYSFRYSLDDLKIKRLTCSLDWMLAICFFRGTLGDFSSSDKIKAIISEIEESDVVIAPIANNKMFYIMAQFTEGEINADVALHSLSASDLGLQYVFRSEKALKSLKPMERYFICEPEREDCRKALVSRGYEIDTKLKLAKREFRDGLYIEEVLK
ncbi:MAG: DUF3990 domain-containing protein [Clostridiales bacterium]|nr:DUF3990 domain-containing protein [Clostridiales bacterium]